MCVCMYVKDKPSIDSNYGTLLNRADFHVATPESCSTYVDVWENRLAQVHDNYNVRSHIRSQKESYHIENNDHSTLQFPLKQG